MTERTLELKIALARAGLSQSAAGAAATIQSALQGIQADVGVDRAKLDAELKAVEAFTRGAFDDIPVGFSVDADGKLRNELGQFVETTKRQIEVGLQGLEIDLDLDEENVKRAEQAIEDLAEETLQTARQAKFLKEAYNLNDKEVDQVIRKMDQLEKETAEAKNQAGGLNGAIAGLAGGAAFAAINALQEQLGKVLNLIASIPGRLSSAADANADYERTLLGLEKQLESSGGQVGFTSDQLVNFASDLGEATLTSEEAVLRASRSLLSFRSVVGTAFTRGVSVSQDLAEVLGGDLESNIIQVGKALEDPINGLTALSRSGTQFNAEQKNLIRSLVESGDLLGAQDVILTELERQYGGTAIAAAQGLEGIKDTLGEFRNDLQRGLGGAISPAFEGLNLLLSEILSGLKEVDLSELTESSERLKEALVGNPEQVEAIVDAFVDLAQQGVDGLTQIIDGLTALTSNQDAVDSFTDGVEDLGTVIGAIADGTAFVIALAEGFIVLKQQAEGIPIIGGYLSALLNPIDTLITKVQGLREVSGETLAQLGTNLVRVAELIGRLPGFDDLAASAKSLGQNLQDLGTTEIDPISSGLAKEADEVEAKTAEVGDALNKGLNQAVSNINTPDIPPPSPPDLGGIADAYKQLTTELEVEQAKQRATLLENKGTQEEVAAQEQQFLQERINAAKTQLDELRAINADGLDPDQAQVLQDQILSIERQAANDRAALAKARNDAEAQAAEASAQMVEQSEAAKADAAEQSAEDRAKAAEEARKAEIDAVKEQAAAEEELASIALDRQEAQLAAADRVAEAYDRQNQLLSSQLSLFDAQADLQNTLFDAREGRLKDILDSEESSDSERQKAAADLIKLTEERAAKEKQQLEQRQALERQQLAIQQQAAALADERAIKEEQFALKKLELQRLELENEARIAALEGDPAAVEIANAKLASLDEQAKLQGEIIASRQQDAQINAQTRQNDRRELLANQQQQDVDLAVRQADTARGLAGQFDDLPNVDRRAEQFSDRTARNELRESRQADRFLTDLLRGGAALPAFGANPDAIAPPIATAPSPEQLGADFSRPIVEAIHRLNANLAAVAQNPRSISVSTPDPFQDLSAVLGAVADLNTGGVEP